MFVKLTSGLQTKNYLGIKQDDLDNMIHDIHYNYLREPMVEEVISERGGSLIVLKSTIEYNVHKDYAAIIQPHPDLHKFGLVSYNAIITKGHAEFHIKAYKSGPLELDYLYEVRLVK